MSTFFLYKHGHSPLEESVLDTISKKLVHFPHIRTNRYITEGLQLVYTINRSDGMRIFHHKERGLTFFLQGNIFESSKGIEKIDASKEEHSLENQIIGRYLKSGIASCVGLNGLYNLFVFDERQGFLETAGDRLGIFQMFFAPLANDQFVLTSDIITLKHVPGYVPKINRRGIFDLLYMGIAYENRTVLEGVDRLLPNACYRISGGQLALLEKFRLPFSKERWGYVTPKILDELEYYYMQAVKRQLKQTDQMIYLQSGGRDSRVFSHFLKKAKIRPSCVTLGSQHHGETFLASKVSKHLGFPWKRISINNNFNPLYASRCLEIDSFSRRIFGTWIMEIVNSISREWDFAVTTFMGDSVFGTGVKNGSLEKGNNPLSAFNHYLKFWRKGLPTDPDLRQLFPEEAESWIAEYQKESFDLFESLGDDPYQMLVSYGLRSIDRFKIGSPFRLISAAIPMRAPYLDNDLMDFLFSLPPFLMHNRLLIDIFLTQRSKSLAAIPIDRNSQYYESLVPSLKNLLSCRCWDFCARKLKIPFLRVFDPVSATTQFYVQVYSTNDKGFQNLTRAGLSNISLLEGVCDISEARRILKQPLPGTDHIASGSSKRVILTLISLMQSFKRSSGDL